MKFTANAAIAVMRNDQQNPRLLIIAPVARHQINPPTPLPAEARPLAKDLRFVNHWEMTPEAARNWKPDPHPNRAP